MTPCNRKKQLSVISSAVLGTLVASYTSTGLAAESEKRVLEEVVITAEKRTESLQDVPVAITAFAGDELVKLGIGRTQDMQFVTPGMVFTNTGKVPQIRLRGIGSGFASVGADPSIGTYVDDRYIGRPGGSIFDLADIERIEVLKGPQGTLYGRNVTGGAIRVITKGVADEQEGSIRASVGNYNMYGVSGTVSGPLTDTLGYRFSASTRKRDGYAENEYDAGVSELDDSDIQTLRAKFLWEPTDNVSAELAVGYWVREDMEGGDLIVIGDKSQDPSLLLGAHTGELDVGDQKVWTAINDPGGSDEQSVALRVDVDLDISTFSSITTYAKLNTDINTDVDGTEFGMLDSYAHENAETWSQEFQVVSNGGETWDWIVGMYFFREDADVDSGLSIFDTDPFLNFTFVPGGGFYSTVYQVVQTNAEALYGQLTWHLADQWDLTVGGRYSREEKEIAYKQSPYAPYTDGWAVAPGFRDTADWDEFSPKVTLEYHTSADSMYYLTYSTGFKSGGYSQPAHSGSVLDPEILDMFELGMKGAFLDNTLSMNAALFYYDFTDLHVQRPNPVDPANVSIENAANANVTGLEMDMIWLATEKLMVNAGFSIMDSEYKDYQAVASVYNGFGTSTVPFDADGHSLLRTPDWSGYLTLTYDFVAGDAVMPASLTYAYKDDYDFHFIVVPEAEDARQDAHGVLNFRLGYEPAANWSAALWVNNVTEEEYWDDVTFSFVGMQGSPGAPRTFGLDFTYDF